MLLKKEGFLWALLNLFIVVFLFVFFVWVIQKFTPFNLYAPVATAPAPTGNNGGTKNG